MNILLGVTSGISAYKVPELIRILIKNGHNVKVVLTPNASKFITDTVIYTLTNTKPYKESFPEQYTDDPMYHISLSKWADVYAIAPATANTIGKLANGIGDNLLTTLALSFRKNILLFPAMNVNMWQNRIVQNNISKLRDFDFFVMEPSTGFLACGDEGPGRLPDIGFISRAIEIIGKYGQDLRGKRVGVTAGATREYIDPIRFISNPASGMMGYALAVSAYIRGAEVVLFAPNLPDYVRVTKFVRFERNEDLLNGVKTNLNEFDIFISAAAIADFKPSETAKKKIKKETESIKTIELIRTQDILSFVKKVEPQKVCIGFSLETENTIENARKKLQSKNLQFIIANSPANFGQERGDFYIISQKEVTELRNITKFELANKILSLIK